MMGECGTLEIAGAIGSAITPLTVGIAIWEIVRAKRQAQADFEDDVAREYREIIKGVPIKAMFGEDLTGDEYAQALPALFHYIDLSNEEVFLRQHRRVRKETWMSWCDGIRCNLARPAFRRAWAEIKDRVPDSFHELRHLEAVNFKEDPADFKVAVR